MKRFRFRHKAFEKAMLAPAPMNLIDESAGKLARVVRDGEGSLHRGAIQPRPHAFLMPLLAPKRNGVAVTPGSGPNYITPLGGGWWAFDRPAYVTRVHGGRRIENPVMVEPGQRVRIVSRGGRFYAEVDSSPGGVEDRRGNGGGLVAQIEPDAAGQRERENRQANDISADESHGAIVRGRTA